MKPVSLFTPVIFDRPCSNSEIVLSKLSIYFYLGGLQASVISGDLVELKNGNISCHIVALKIASYILLFPLTITLLAVNFALRSRHNFTVFVAPTRREYMEPPAPRLTLIPNAPDPVRDRSSRSTLTEVLVDQLSSRSTLTEVLVDQLAREVSNQVVATTSVKEPFFRPFTLKISGKELLISSSEEFHLRARELGQHVGNNHLSIRIDTSSNPFDYESGQFIGFSQFIGELRKVVNVISTRFENLFYIIPNKTEETQGNLIIRRYENGVIEEVQTQSNRETTWEDWVGRRIYPNGVIETEGLIDLAWLKAHP